MRSARILIVEDERIIAMNLARRVQRLGYTVAALATSAHEAIAQAEVCQPDLILMDISLQGAMNGLEAGAQICARRPVPVVYLTGHPAVNLIEGVGPLGSILYLHKPVNEQTLGETIARALPPLLPTLC